MCHRKCYLLTKDKIYDAIDTEPKTEQRNSGACKYFSGLLHSRQHKNVSVQSRLHKDWQSLDLSSLSKFTVTILFFFIYQTDEQSEITAAFLSLCTSVQEIWWANLIWSQGMNHVRTFLCSCGEVKGLGVDKKEWFLLPFPITVQPRSMLCFYSQISNLLFACFLIGYWKYKQF